MENKKLRIAQVVSMRETVPPQGKGGLEFVVSWLTEELVKRGHDVTLFAPAGSETKAKLVSILPHSLSSKPHAAWEETFFSIQNTIAAASSPKGFDIIHCHNLNGAYISPFVSGPVIETLHGPYTRDYENSFLTGPMYQKNLDPIISHYKKIHYVAISKDQETKYLEAASSYFKHSSLIYNGIPVSDFVFNDAPDDYLLFIGYINKNKGADVAVQVAKKLGKKLILAGECKGEEAFFDAYIKPYLNDQISYFGPADFKQKNELYKNALATLAPLAWDEPFGLTLAESQACGTPVIAFDRGAAKEVIENGKTGFIVRTEQEMIEAVNKISTIKRTDCRAHIEKHFSVEKMTDSYEALYQKLL